MSLVFEFTDALSKFSFPFQITATRRNGVLPTSVCLLTSGERRDPAAVAGQLCSKAALTATHMVFVDCSGRGQSNEAPVTEGHHYCVDENTERRNHYLDLAGIENYTSRFEGKRFDITADVLLLEYKKLDCRCVSMKPEK